MNTNIYLHDTTMNQINNKLLLFKKVKIMKDVNMN